MLMNLRAIIISCHCQSPHALHADTDVQTDTWKQMLTLSLGHLYHINTTCHENVLYEARQLCRVSHCLLHVLSTFSSAQKRGVCYVTYSDVLSAKKKETCSIKENKMLYYAAVPGSQIQTFLYSFTFILLNVLII